MLGIFFLKKSCLIETSKLLLNIVEKSRFALPKVMRQQFTGEVGTFITDVDFFQDAVYQKKIFISVDFYRATLCVSAVFAVAWCPSVRPSVCLFVCHVGGLYPDG